MDLFYALINLADQHMVIALNKFLAQKIMLYAKMDHAEVNALIWIYKQKEYYQKLINYLDYLHPIKLVFQVIQETAYQHK